MQKHWLIRAREKISFPIVRRASSKNFFSIFEKRAGTRSDCACAQSDQGLLFSIKNKFFLGNHNDAYNQTAKCQGRFRYSLFTYAHCPFYVFRTVYFYHILISSFAKKHIKPRLYRPKITYACNYLEPKIKLYGSCHSKTYLRSYANSKGPD